MNTNLWSSDKRATTENVRFIIFVAPKSLLSEPPSSRGLLRGNDRLRVRDQDGRDEVTCDGGFDRVRADVGDECEVVNKVPFTP